MDGQGTEVVRPFVEEAGAKFPVVVDSVDCLWDSYGFDHLPNGYDVERGIIRYLKIGGFDIRETLNVKIIEDLISEKWSKKPLRFPERPKVNLKKEIADLGQQLKSVTRGVEKRLRLADLLVKAGQYRKAAREYDTVLVVTEEARALFGRGVVSHREGKVPQAILSWRKAFTSEPTTGIRKQIGHSNFPSAFTHGFMVNGRAANPPRGDSGCGRSETETQTKGENPEGVKGSRTNLVPTLNLAPALNPDVGLPPAKYLPAHKFRPANKSSIPAAIRARTESVKSSFIKPW